MRTILEKIHELLGDCPPLTRIWGVRLAKSILPTTPSHFWEPRAKVCVKLCFPPQKSTFSGNSPHKILGQGPFFDSEASNLIPYTGFPSLWVSFCCPLLFKRIQMGKLDHSPEKCHVDHFGAVLKLLSRLVGG